MNNEDCDSRRLSLPLDARVPRLRKVSRQGDRPPKRFRRGVDGKLLAVYNKSVCVDGWRGGWLMQSDRGRTYAETCGIFCGPWAVEGAHRKVGLGGGIEAQGLEKKDLKKLKPR